MLSSKPPAQTNSHRPGNVTIVVVVCITMLLGIVAVALDGGMLQDNKRRVQNAADAAAVAAANKLFKNYQTIITTTTADPGGQGSTAAFLGAEHNGFKHNGGDTTVVVKIPPATGLYVGKLGYAEVTITYKQPRYFSAIWSSTATTIKARAVAKGYWGATGNGVIVLDPTAKDALNSSGGASATVTGGAAMVVNSNNIESAARCTGGGTLTAARFDIVGGYDGVFNGPVNTGLLPTPDPLAYLPVPNVTTLGTITEVQLGMGNKMYTLTPGLYTNLPSFQVGDVVILKQYSYDNSGIYYIDNGGFTSQGATILMDPLTSGGVMIYNGPTSAANSHSINISGNAAGSVTLSALTSGPYAGILFWQERGATVDMSISGQGSFNLTGTFYAPNADLKVSGNGTAIIGSQYISRTLTLGGNGGVNINYTDQGTARKREVRIVE